ADGRVERTCRIAVPESEFDLARDTFADLPAVKSFLQVLATLGTGGVDCRGPWRLHDEDARLAELRAAMRPWAIVDADAATLEADYGRAVKLLAAWAEQETWNWREYQTLVGQHIAPAQASVAKYLTAQFGLEPAVAKVRAEEIIRGLVVSWLHVPRSER